MTFAATLLTMGALLAATGTLLGGLRYYQLRCRPDPEVVRKLFHIGGGALGLSLPWIFDDLAPVLVLGIAIMGMFAVIRILPRLRDGVGQVFLAVERRTVGEFSFLLSFCLLFWLARGDKLLYSIPILMVALADALAALIGQSYGKRPLHIAGDAKTVEGAVTFFLIAFLCVHVPVLLWGQTGRLESLLIAVNVAAMVMLAEAAAWRGLDNLIVPLWGYMVLKSLLEATSPQLAVDLLFLASLGAFTMVWRSRATLGDDALAGAVLWGYVAWSVGGLPWALAPLLQLAAYATVTARTPLDSSRNLRFPVVLANVAASVLWLLAFRETGDPALFVPFATCFGANVAIIALTRVRFADPALPLRHALAMSTVAGMLIVVPSMLAAYGLESMAAFGAAAGLLAVVAAAALFHRIQPGLASMPVDAARWARQALVVAAASLLAYGLLQLAERISQ